MSSVTVVGSVNLDLVAMCTQLPRSGQTVSANDLTRHPGGKGANQALAAQRAGSRVALVAAVGADAEAGEALALLEADGIDLGGVVVSDTAATGLALITVDEAGENQIVVVPGANSSLRPEDLDLGDPELVLCQLEIPVEVVTAAAEATDGLFCINAAPARDLPDHVWERADLIIVNEGEREALADALSEISALVVVTLGAAGAKAYRSRKLVAEALPPPVTVVDTVGAGDAFCGALVTRLLEGMTVEAALRFACAAGALAATRPGAQPSLPTRDEIMGVVLG